MISFRRRVVPFVISVIVAWGAFAPATAQQVANERVSVLVNGRLWTGDSAAPWAEAIALRGGRILAVGSEDEVFAAVGADVDRMDLTGAFVTPGFIDGHTHFNRAGALLLGANLLDVSDDASFRRRLSEADDRLPAGSWMLRGDWGAYDLETTWVPSKEVLDEVIPNRPAFVNKWDRSQYLANSAALRAAGINPAGHDGLLSGEELSRVRRAVPPPSFAQRLAENRLALHDLARHGVTTIHDITGSEQMGQFQYLRDHDSLTVRVCTRPTLDKWEQLAAVGIQNNYGGEWINICGLKGFVDGIMGNSTAMFREPYDHTPENHGRWRTMMSPPGNMENLILSADAAGLTATIHAIGDLAVDTLLDMVEMATAVNGPRDRRFRMVHAQVVEPDDFARFGELGVIAEINPFHAIDDMRWMEDRIGERSIGAYAFRSLKDGGALLVFGSDWPGTNAAWYPTDPMQMIYAAVTRQTLDGLPEGGWYPAQRLTVQEALEAHTINGAYAAFEEDVKGKLAPGYMADLTVLSQNLFEIDPDAIKDVRVLRTMVNGKWVYIASTLRP
ncbi:MAG: amidohydrolase [Gemmatimonadetes bacterium]|nr:amidohydrolase [Gemmatimonadota bacterium]